MKNRHVWRDVTLFHHGYNSIFLIWRPCIEKNNMKRKKLSEKPFADTRAIAGPVCFAEPEDIAVHGYFSRYLRDRWGLEEPKKPTKVVLTLFVHSISNVCNFNSTPKNSDLSIWFCPVPSSIYRLLTCLKIISASWIKMTRSAPGIPNEFDFSSVMFYPDQQDITPYACKHSYT